MMAVKILNITRGVGRTTVEIILPTTREEISSQLKRRLVLCPKCSQSLAMEKVTNRTRVLMVIVCIGAKWMSLQ